MEKQTINLEEYITRVVDSEFDCDDNKNYSIRLIREIKKKVLRNKGEAELTIYNELIKIKKKIDAFRDTICLYNDMKDLSDEYLVEQGIFLHKNDQMVFIIDFLICVRDIWVIFERVYKLLKEAKACCCRIENIEQTWDNFRFGTIESYFQTKNAQKCNFVFYYGGLENTDRTADMSLGIWYRSGFEKFDDSRREKKQDNTRKLVAVARNTKALTVMPSGEAIMRSAFILEEMIDYFNQLEDKDYQQPIELLSTMLKDNDSYRFKKLQILWKHFIFRPQLSLMIILEFAISTLFTNLFISEDFKKSNIIKNYGNNFSIHTDIYRPNLAKYNDEFTYKQKLRCLITTKCTPCPHNNRHHIHETNYFIPNNCENDKGIEFRLTKTHTYNKDIKDGNCTSEHYCKHPLHCGKVVPILDKGKQYNNHILEEIRLEGYKKKGSDCAANIQVITLDKSKFNQMCSNISETDPIDGLRLKSIPSILADMKTIKKPLRDIVIEMAFFLSNMEKNESFMNNYFNNINSGVLKISNGLMQNTRPLRIGAGSTVKIFWGRFNHLCVKWNINGNSPAMIFYPVSDIYSLGMCLNSFRDSREFDLGGTLSSSSFDTSKDEESIYNKDDSSSINNYMNKFYTTSGRKRDKISNNVDNYKRKRIEEEEEDYEEEEEQEEQEQEQEEQDYVNQEDPNSLFKFEKEMTEDSLFLD